MILKDWLDKNYTKEEQKSLTLLICFGEGITSLEGIELLVNLEYLDCDVNLLLSLKGIDNLSKLQRLYCYNNKLTSLKGIEKLNNLQYLNYHNNPLTYSDLFNLDKIKLELKKEVRQEKIHKLLNSVL